MRNLFLLAIGLFTAVSATSCANDGARPEPTARQHGARQVTDASHQLPLLPNGPSHDRTRSPARQAQPAPCEPSAEGAEPDGAVPDADASPRSERAPTPHAHPHVQVDPASPDDARAFATTVTDVSIDPGIVAIGLGSRDGVRLGLQFSISRGAELIGRIELVMVAEQYSVGRLVFPYEGARARVGDAAVCIAVPGAPRPEIVTGELGGGEVLSVDERLGGVVIINRGNNHGLQLHQTLTIVRGDQYCARIEIVNLYEERAAGLLIRETVMRDIRVGDTIKAPPTAVAPSTTSPEEKPVPLVKFRDSDMTVDDWLQGLSPREGMRGLGDRRRGR